MFQHQGVERKGGEGKGEFEVGRVRKERDTGEEREGAKTMEVREREGERREPYYSMTAVCSRPGSLQPQSVAGLPHMSLAL